MGNRLISINRNLQGMVLRKEIEIITEVKADSVSFMVDDGSRNSAKMLRMSFFTDSTMGIDGINSQIAGLRFEIAESDAKSILCASSKEKAFENALRMTKGTFIGVNKELHKMLEKDGVGSEGIRNLNADIAKINWYIESLGRAHRKD